MNFMLNIYKGNIKWNSIERKKNLLEFFFISRKNKDLVTYAEWRDFKFYS